MDLNKFNDENDEQFIWRICSAKDSGLLDMDWNEVADLLNRELKSDDTEYMNESAYRKPFQQAKRFYDANVFKDLTSDKYAEVIKEETRQLIKERQKLRDEKLEYNKWLRESARDELICEKIRDEIKSIKPLDFPKPKANNYKTNKEAILCFADTHYGCEFSLKGLFGEIINEYNPEIFEKRMNSLFDKTLEVIKEKNLTNIRIFSLGDEIDGILRVSQLQKLKYGLIESTIKYSEYICNWLNKLSNYVHIDFYAVQGNHTELRLISQPKGTFTNENMSLVINEFIKERLKDNPNFEFHINESGLIFDTICGYNILGIHGEVKNMETAIQQFTNTYNTMIDILVAGHKHHFSATTVGNNRDVINVPSVIGTDDYALSLGKSSNAGAIMFILEENNGIVEQRNFKL